MSKTDAFAEQILNLIPTGLVVVDSDQQIIAWNAEMESISGFPAAEVLRRTLFDVYPELSEQLRVLWQALTTQSTLRRLEVNVRHRDGQLMPLGFSAGLLSGTQAQPATVIIIVRDLSAQKRNEALLTALNEAGRAASLARTADEVFAAVSRQLQRLGLRTLSFLLDETGEYLVLRYVSLRTEDLQHLDQKWRDALVGSRLRATDTQFFRRIQQTGQPLFVSDKDSILSTAVAQKLQQFTFADAASSIPLGCSILTPLWRDNKVIGQLAVEGDVRPEDVAAIDVFGVQLSAALANANLWENLEQRVAERTATLQAEQNRLNAILAHMADAVLFTDADERIVYANPAWERLNGYGLSEVVGKRPTILKSSKTPTDLSRRIQQTLTKGERWQGELYNRRKDGSTYETQLTIVPVCDDAGEVVYHVSVNRDITEDKKFLRAKDQFVADMAHELRTPLTNIKFYLSLLERGDPERTERYMATLKREANRLQGIIENLLSLSRLDQDRVEFRLELTDLNTFVAALVAQQQQAATNRQITLAFTPQIPLPYVNIDPDQATQAIVHLLLNALYYTLEGGHITVSTAMTKVGKNSWVQLMVADTGLGIEPEDQEHIFERFFRGQASRTTNTPGTGLGLSLCYEIIHRHGGRINVISQPNQGSTFTVYLPVAQ